MTFMSFPRRLACLALMVIGGVHAGVFEDDEARRAILDLRQRVENLRQAQQNSDNSLQRAVESMGKLQQTLRDQTTKDVQQETSRMQQGLLQLQSQIDGLKQSLSEMRGYSDQLTRDISLLQRSQKEGLSSIDQRLAKMEERFAKQEPVMVQLDGLEFQADPAEKKDYELALATFRKGEFAGAIQAFSSFLRKYPDSGFRQSGLFWLASAKYVKQDYLDAANQLKAFAAMNEGHAKFPEALLTLGNAQIELKLPMDAKKTLNDLVDQYPNTDAAAAAKARLAKLK